MLKFEWEQKTYQIGDVLIGGQPGENPTILVGSIFFTGHRIVSNSDKGEFDKRKAKALLELEAEISAETGNQRIIDVVGETTQSLIKCVEFVVTSCSSPILVDSSLAKVRMETISHFAGSEVAPRLIYNSIEDHCSEEELACMKDCGIRSAVILALSAKAIRPKERITLVKEKLLGAAQRAGIENVLVDTGVLDVASVSWSTQSIWEVKNSLGYPSGCAPANALYQWRKKKAMNSPSFEACGSSVYSLPISWGAGSIFYGSIANAPWVYPACATTDAMVAYGG
jgi:tetrahydromethanopterin S-methyltransferase subunit H